MNPHQNGIFVQLLYENNYLITKNKKFKERIFTKKEITKYKN